MENKVIYHEMIMDTINNPDKFYPTTFKTGGLYLRKYKDKTLWVTADINNEIFVHSWGWMD